MLNRRELLIAGANLGILSLTTTLLSGCDVSAAQVAADGKAVSAALFAIANIEAVSNPGVAAGLRVAANAVVSATSNWTTGTSTALIFSALEGAAQALAAIDPTSQLSQLAAIAYVAITTLQALLPAPPPTLGPQAKSRVNPYAGTPRSVIPHHIGRSPADDFKSAFNKKAVELGLLQAKI